MSHIFPVSPLTSLSKGSKTSTGSIEDLGDLSEEELDPKSVVVDDPIMGEKFVTLDEHGPGAIQPKTIPAPKEMSAIERAKHFASGHLPYDPRCEICVSCKRPNVPHHHSHESDRTIPLLGGDYGFIKDGVDESNATVLVLKLYPFKLIFSCLMSEKDQIPWL